MFVHFRLSHFPRRIHRRQNSVAHREEIAVMAESQLRRVLDSGIVAVVRAPDSDQLVEVARALADGGVDVVEITMSVPNALDVLRQVRQGFGARLLLAAATVWYAEPSRGAFLRGASLIVRP